VAEGEEDEERKEKKKKRPKLRSTLGVEVPTAPVTKRGSLYCVASRIYTPSAHEHAQRVKKE
jgi:hypothetical protein